MSKDCMKTDAEICSKDCRKKQMQKYVSRDCRKKQMQKCVPKIVGKKKAELCSKIVRLKENRSRNMFQKFQEKTDSEIPMFQKLQEKTDEEIYPKLVGKNRYRNMYQDCRENTDEEIQSQIVGKKDAEIRCKSF